MVDWDWYYIKGYFIDKARNTEKQVTIGIWASGMSHALNKYTHLRGVKISKTMPSINKLDKKLSRVLERDYIDGKVSISIAKSNYIFLPRRFRV